MTEKRKRTDRLNQRGENAKRQIERNPKILERRQNSNERKKATNVWKRFEVKGNQIYSNKTQVLKAGAWLSKPGP